MSGMHEEPEAESKRQKAHRNETHLYLLLSTYSRPSLRPSLRPNPIGEVIARAVEMCPTQLDIRIQLRERIKGIAGERYMLRSTSRYTNKHVAHWETGRHCNRRMILTLFERCYGGATMCIPRIATGTPTPGSISLSNFTSEYPFAWPRGPPVSEQMEHARCSCKSSGRWW